MSKTTLLGSIELTKLNNVFIQNKKDKQGNPIPCLCIPIPHNQIYEFPVKDEKGVIQEGQNSNRFGFEFRAVINDEKDQFGRNGFLAKKLTKEEYEANKENADYLKKNQPILGNFVLWGGNVNPDAAGAEIPVMDDDSDDLPF